MGTTGSGTNVNSGAALDLNGFTLSTTEALTLNGTGVSNGGALTNNSATAASYSGLITLGSSSSIITNGDIIITNVGTITGSGFGLTLGGTGSGSLASILGTGTGTLTKTGSGTWTLSGANTYTGTTTISAGTLQLGAADRINNTSNFILNGGIFRTGATTGFNETVGTANLSDNSTIALGTGIHTLTFSSSNGVSWASGKMLTITGWVGGYNGTSGTAGKIFVGSNSGGSTTGQLKQIQFFNGTSNFPATILSNGEVVPTGNSITTGSVSGSPFCGGQTSTVPFTYELASNFTGTFTAQLSDASGSFSPPFNSNIGSVTSDGSGSQTLSVTIPANTSAGGAYRIRVVNNTPIVNGSPNSNGALIIDQTPPVLTPAANQNINLNAGCSIIIPDVRGTATDNCSGSVIITQSPSIGAVISSSHNATINVTVTATDAAGNTDVKTVALTAKDVTPPVIVSVSDINVGTDDGVCNATLNIVAPSASDYCVPGTASGTRSDNLALSAPYPKGTTTITWTYSDGANSATPVQQTITVADDEAPVIASVSDINVGTDDGVCNAILNIAAPSASDNCVPGTASSTRSDNQALSAPYPKGTTTITWTYSDGVISATPVQQTITVADDETPVIASVSDINVGTDDGVCNATLNIAAPSASDNCVPGNASGTRSDNQALNAPYPKGTTTITWIYSDGVNSATPVQQKVTVADDEAPVIASVSDINVGTDDGECNATLNIVAPSASDNCVPGTASGTRSDNQALSAPYPKGTTTITWTYSDGVNTATLVQQTVMVADDENPTITCPANIYLPACQSTATWSTPAASDNCSVESVQQTAGPASGSTFANGTTTTITYTATDGSGNQKSCSFNVTRAAALVASSSATPILCNGGTSTVTVGATGGEAPYTGTGAFTKPAGTYTFTVGDADGCSTTTTITITQPTTLVITPSSNNPNLYFGYTGDQTAMVTFTASNGTAPYKSISITMNRPLKCNQINDAGDEVWAPGSGGSTINNGCPASPGLAILAPVSTKLNTLSYSVTVTLMDDAWIIGTVTDYNNCTKTDSIFVHGEDVRCFAADKPGNPQKVQLCHKTGSTRNPCVTICVDEDAVQEHLLHGDT